MSEILLPKLSYKIMGCLFNVHNELGPSLLEKYYQRSIAEEFAINKLSYKKEHEVKLLYKNKSIGKYFLDFIVEELVIVEVKAQPNYSPRFFKQVLTYLQQTDAPLAIIANFRSVRLSYERVVNPSYKNINLSKKDNEFE